MVLIPDLPLPTYFNPDRIMDVRPIKYGQIAAAARAFAHEHDLSSSPNDETRTALLAVDCQLTFCHPDFELYVAGRSGTGALDDTRRLVEFIYRNLSSITAIHATMDTHKAAQIFFDILFIDEHGNHPTP